MAALRITTPLFFFFVFTQLVNGYHHSKAIRPRVIEARFPSDLSATSAHNSSHHKRLLGLSWSSCGSATDPVQLVSLNVNPDTVHIPGDLTLSAELLLRETLRAPLIMQLNVKRKTFLGWIEIPCVDNFGSCDYGNSCSMLPDSCSAEFQRLGIPCNCPFNQGDYRVNSMPIQIHGHVPHWLERGHYKVEVRLGQPGRQVACYNFESKLD